MKFFTTLGFSLLAVTVLAQSHDSLQRRKIVAFELNGAYTADHYSNMSISHIQSTASNPSDLKFNNAGLNEAIGTKSGTVSLHLNVVLKPKFETNSTIYNKSQLIVGLGIHSSREMRVGYVSETLDTAINICNLSNETSFGLSYVFDVLRDRHITFYTGLSGIGSISRNNEVMILGGPYYEASEHPRFIISRPENRLSYEAKTLVYSRLFAVAGVRIKRSDKLDYFFQYRPGVGLQYVPNEKIYLIPYTGSLSFGCRVYLNKNFRK
jgi:hypothetical protein